MREVTFFWKKERLLGIDVGPMYDVVKQITFLSYVKRVPKDIRCVFKVDFLKGKTPEMLNELYYLEVLEILHKPTDDSDPYLLLMRLDHPLPNMNARTGGSTTMAGSRLDGEGLTYTIQGKAMKLRLLSGLARLMLKPDRTSARALNLSVNSDQGPLKPKQMQLAKYAYDQGYYDIPKRVRITDLSEGIGLARATVSEHLNRIEAIIMDDMFSSFDRQYLKPEEMKMIVETIEIEARDNHNDEDASFQRLLSTIKKNIAVEDSSTNLKNELFEDISDDEIEDSMKAYNEKNNNDS
ncbi:MAG TPA: hypothetical protein EYQ58_02550 [Candidatus Poseidoniales archaeon]|nr:MAG: hypothetical protein CXT70_02095 [Euryarchaeota archaeon]HIF90415.1 hypothetical protein [Candidatus Poseidoniales archaeon]